MGQKFSQPETPPPDPTLIEEWREIPWDDKEENLQYVKNYKPHSSKIQHLRILLHGPPGAGKSSFINSVDTVFQRRVIRKALVETNADKSFTKKYKTYRIEKGDPETFYSFVFNDTMSLEGRTNSGVHPEDVKLAMKGRVRDGYRFNPVTKLSEEDPGYNSSPSPDDKVHVMVCVVPADTVSLLSKEVVQKVRDIRLAASDMGIPQLAVFTKVDEACREIQKNIRNVYKSKYLKTKMEEFSGSVGIPLNCIFPVKNYHSENTINDDTDSLILDALRQMINSGEDFVNGT